MRLLFPDEGSRLAYRVYRKDLRAVADSTATLYTDAAGTILADIRSYDGTQTPGPVIAGSVVTVDAYSRLPLFWGPDGAVDTLYAVIYGGPPAPVIARFDERIDALNIQVANLEAGTGPYDPTGAAFTRLRVVALGDSTVAGGLKDRFGVVVQVGNAYDFTNKIIGNEQAGPQSWLTHACFLSGGRLSLVHNAGVASDTSVGCLARFATDVTAYQPDVVLIQGAVHNDLSVGSGITVAQTRANIVAMIRLARAAGIIPILVTAFCDNSITYAPGLRRYNAWLKTLAAGRDANYPDIGALICVDLYAALVNPVSTTGAYTAAYTSDGTHPNTAGSVVAGQRCLDDLAGLLRGNTTKWGPYAPSDRVNDTNLFKNPLMQDDINVDGIADFWAVTANTKSLVVDAAVIGKAQKMDITSGTGGASQQLTVDGSLVSVGDRLKYAGLAKVTALVGSLNWNLELQFPGRPGISQPIAQVVGLDYDWFYYECEAIVPTGATLVRPGITTTAGTGSLWLAQQACINMTTL